MSNAGAEEPTPAAERLNAAIDRLLAEQRPAEPVAGSEDAELWPVAALLKQARADLATPRPDFLAALDDRLRAAGPRPARRVSRRQALTTGAAGAGALAAGAAGFAIARLAEPSAAAPAPSAGATSRPPAYTAPRELTLAEGEWTAVAQLAEVPPGAVVPFTAGAVLGHLLNQNGTFVAFSAICTHMGCVLKWKEGSRRFLCPCHGASFGTDGVIIPRPDYPYTPPPLPRLQVKVEGDQVWVMGTGDPPPILRRHEEQA